MLNLPGDSSTRLCTLYLLFFPVSWAFVQAEPIRIEDRAIKHEIQSTLTSFQIHLSEWNACQVR